MTHTLTRNAVPARRHARRFGHGITLDMLEQRRMLSTTSGTGDPTPDDPTTPGLDVGFDRSGVEGFVGDPADWSTFQVLSGMRATPAGLNLSAHSVGGVYMTYGDLFVVDQNGNQVRDQLDEGRVREHARIAASRGERWVVNIEHWASDIRGEDPQAVQETVAKFVQMVEWAHDERPDVQIGIYGVLPVRDYWTPVHHAKRVDQLQDTLADSDSSQWHRDLKRSQLAETQANMDAWRQANAALQELGDAVDFIAPSLYTFYGNTDQWVDYAIGNIVEAQQYGKPVMPFLMPNYHNMSGFQANEFIDGDFWRLQLDTVADNADSVVIWRGYGGFEGNEDWWTQTSEFAALHAAADPSTPFDGTEHNSGVFNNGNEQGPGTMQTIFVGEEVDEASEVGVVVEVAPLPSPEPVEPATSRVMMRTPVLGSTPTRPVADAYTTDARKDKAETLELEKQEAGTAARSAAETRPTSVLAEFGKVRERAFATADLESFSEAIRKLRSERF